MTDKKTTPQPAKTQSPEIEKILESVPKEKREQVISQIVSMERTHIGPLPDPQTLQSYADIIPDGANRVMKMAENQLEHRMYIEKKAIRGQLNQSNIGQILAFIIGIFAIGCGTYCIVSGHDWSGSILGGAGVIGLVTAFIQGKKEQQKDLDRKKETLKKK